MPDMDHTFDDTITLSESTVTDKDKVFDDTITLAETTVTDKDKVFADAITLADAPLVNKDLIASDAIALRDQGVNLNGNVEETRTHPHTAKLYMAIEVPRIIWKGRVTATGDRGCNTYGLLETDLTINITGGANEVGFDINNFLPDLTLWVGSTDGGAEHGKCRLKRFNGANLVVAADMTCVWHANDYISVTDQHAYWAMLHKVTIEPDESLLVLKDQDITSSDKAEEPVPIMGPPHCGFIDALSGLATFRFYGADSYVVQPNSDEHYWTAENGIASYAWWFEGGTPSTSTSANPTVTWNTAGRYVVSLNVTGENGKSYKGFRNLWVFARTGANAPLTDFNLTRLAGSIQAKGWEAEIELIDDTFNPALFPEDAQAVIFTEEWFGGTAKTFEIGNPARHGCENIKFVGYVGEVAVNYGDGKKRSATAMLRGLQQQLQREVNFPIYFSQIEVNLPGWSDFAYPVGLTMRKVLYHLVRWHWTLMRFTDYFIPDDHNNYLPGQNFSEGSLATELDEFTRDIQAKWTVDRGGAVHVYSWPNWLPVSGDGAGWRSRLYNAVNLSDADFMTVEIEPRAKDQVARVRVEGIVADGTGYYDWTIDMAPGLIKNYGGASIVMDRQVLGTGGVEGSQGWELARCVYAEESRAIESVRLSLMGNYSFLDIAPGCNYFTLTLNPSQALRGVSWTSKAFWVTAMNVNADVGTGDIGVEITAIPETKPDTSVLVYTEPDSIEDPKTEYPAGGSFDLSGYLKEQRNQVPTRIPAVMGDGGEQTAGVEPGTSVVRLFGDLNQTVVVENHLVADVENRPVWVRYVPPELQGQGPRWTIEGPRTANDGDADTTLDRAFTQHFAVFCPSSVALPSGTYSAPTFVVRRYQYTLKSVSAYVQTASGTGAITMVLYKNGAPIKTFSIPQSTNDSGIQTITGAAVSGDRFDVAITAAGVGAAGLSIEVEMWRYGI